MPGENNRNSPTRRGPQHIGQINRQEMRYQGPIPPVEDFAGYVRILPGAADRILKMAENQAGHRQTLERRALTGDLIKAMMVTILAYITFRRRNGGSCLSARPCGSGLGARRYLRPQNLRRHHPTESTIRSRPKFLTCPASRSAHLEKYRFCSHFWACLHRRHEGLTQ